MNPVQPTTGSIAYGGTALFILAIIFFVTAILFFIKAVKK